MEKKKLTYTMRALSAWNLLQLVTNIALIAVCIFSAITYILNGGSLWQMVPILFIWPLVRMAYLIGNRYIRVEDERLIFNVEQAHSSMLSLPKFYTEKILLKDLEFYGVYTDLYVKNVKLANRKKGQREPFDIITVKEGDIEVPVGMLKLGNPLAFVTKYKDSYVYEDSIFTTEQIEYLFYVIEHNSNKKASGFVEAKQTKNIASKSIASFIFTVLVVAVFMGLSLLVPALPTLWDASKTFTLFEYSQLETIYIIFLVCGHIALAVIAYAKKVLMKSNAIAADIIVLVAAVSMALFYGVAIILFIITVI